MSILGPHTLNDFDWYFNLFFQIYDSALISPIDRTHTDINLNDVFLFNKVSAHFEVTIEVYCKLINANNSTSTLVKDAEEFLGKTPQKIVRSISKGMNWFYIMRRHFCFSSKWNSMQFFDELIPLWNLHINLNTQINLIV